jgi:hypothetical protein
MYHRVFPHVCGGALPTIRALLWQGCFPSWFLGHTPPLALTITYIEVACIEPTDFQMTDETIQTPALVPGDDQAEITRQVNRQTEDHVYGIRKEQTANNRKQKPDESNG